MWAAANNNNDGSKTQGRFLARPPLSFFFELLYSRRRRGGAMGGGGMKMVVGVGGDGRVPLPARMNRHEWESMPTRCNSGDTYSTERGGGQHCGGWTGV